MNHPRLSRSGIEYFINPDGSQGYVWNFYSGCRNWKKQASQARICDVGMDCWAMGTTRRFESHYPNGFQPTFYPEAFLSPLELKKPSIIGVCFMGDLFGDWVDPNMLISLPDSHGETFAHQKLKELVFTTIKACPQHTFVFLTKCPWNLPKWNPWPDNCRVGATVCTDLSFVVAAVKMAAVDAKVKWLSFEPLLTDMWAPHLTISQFNWLVIGSYQLKSYSSLEARAGQYHIPQLQIMKYGNNWTLQPRIDWVKKLVDAADAAGIKVFLKGNLSPLVVTAFLRRMDDYSNLMARDEKGGLIRQLRQEVP